MSKDFRGAKRKKTGRKQKKTAKGKLKGDHREKRGGEVNKDIVSLLNPGYATSEISRT